MPRPPSIQFYYKQYLGDNKVLAMDWDARGMHVHLLMLSIQEEPPGTLPADDAAIRRWLSLPIGSADSERTWRRVKSQLLAAWQPEGDRLVNRGMVEACARQETYRNRYEIGTKKARDVNADVNSTSKPTNNLKELELKPIVPRVDKTGTRIPPGFKVSDEVRDFARVNALPDPDLHIAEFIDYWTSIPGQRGVKLDWPATFRNWLRRAPNYKHGGSYDDNSQAGRVNGKRTNAQTERAANNVAAVLAAFPELGRPGAPDSAGQAARHRGSNAPLLEGEIKEFPR